MVLLDFIYQRPFFIICELLKLHIVMNLKSILYISKYNKANLQLRNTSTITRRDTGETRLPH